MTGVIRPPIPRTRRARRAVLLGSGAALAAGALLGTVLAAAHGSTPAGHRAAASDGLPHTALTVTSGTCGAGWTRPRGGRQVLDVHNADIQETEVDLVDLADGAVLGEIEPLAPGTTRPLRVTLGNGRYALRCLPEDAPAANGAAVTVTGAPAGTHTSAGAVPLTEHDLIPPTLAYQKWVGGQLKTVVRRTRALADAVDRGDLPAARRAWLPAHLAYARLGAAYDAFGDLGDAMDGTDAGLAGGTHDKDFTGFHRVEYGLWHGQSAHELRGPADLLAKDAAKIRTRWSRDRMDPADLGLRAHEILEDAERFELTGRTDFGSGSGLATARAEIDATREVLKRLRPLLTGRYPGLKDTGDSLDRAATLLDHLHAEHGRWPALSALSRSERERVNAAFGDAVERLAPIAGLCDPRRTS
jgi:iron uptake system component EfeO